MIQLQAQAPGGQMMLIMVVAIVFFMVIPQIRKTRNEKKFKTSLEKGTKVVTLGGIHGKISDVNETTVMIETNAGKLLVEKSAISMELTKRLNAPASTK